MTRINNILLVVLLILVLCVSSVLSQEFGGSNNVKRFLGKWNFYRDGWQHSIEIGWNINCMWSGQEAFPITFPHPPLWVKYYGQLNCQGPVLWEGYGWTVKDRSHPYSHQLFLIHPAPSRDSAEDHYIRGYIYTEAESNMSGYVQDKWGMWGWMAVHVEYVY
jgi:hypothetical protein